MSAAFGIDLFIDLYPLVESLGDVWVYRNARRAEVAEGFSYVLSAARAHGVSWPVAHAAFVEHVTPVLAPELPAVAVPGIDETRRGKPVWAQDLVTGRWRVLHDRWHTAVVDAAAPPGCSRTSMAGPPRL